MILAVHGFEQRSQPLNLEISILNGSVLKVKQIMVGMVYQVGNELIKWER
jgi:hypothetical protein